MRNIGQKTASLLLTFSMLFPIGSVGPACGYSGDELQEQAFTGACNVTCAAPITEAYATAALYGARLLSAASTLPDPPVLPEAVSADGLVMNKAVTQDGDGYQIMLEAYTTGNITVQHTTKPLDIVLVIDQSGSMGYDLKSYEYAPVYSVTAGTSYFVREGGEYIEVNYCSYCDGWTDGCYSFFGHYKGKEYVPMTSEEDPDVTHSLFCTRSESSQKRLDALTDALSGFVESVESKAKGPDGAAGTDDDVDHRIALVGFSSDGFNNTELLTGVTLSEGEPIQDSNSSYYPDGRAHNGVPYGSITAAQYQNALQDVSRESGRQSVEAAVAALTAHGGTDTLDGLDMACRILDGDVKQDEDRNRVVILFTDGETNSSRSGVVNKAYALKHDSNATVYTIGIFEGANGALSSHTNNLSENNTLMHALSSNYPDARYITSGYQRGYAPGEPNPELEGGESYYLSADNSQALSEIFVSIDKQIGAETLDLSRETVVRDEVTEYFCLPDSEGDITVLTYDCTGYEDGTPQWSDNGTPVEDVAVVFEPEARTVCVSGFDFEANYVSETGRDEADDTAAGAFRGRKLVITFTVSVRDGFLGGNNVPTNGESSGIYAGMDESEPTGRFRMPTVNVPIQKPICRGADKNIYLGGETPGAQELFDVESSETEPWQRAYVSPGAVCFADESLIISNTGDTENIEICISVAPRYSGNGADCGTANPAEAITASAAANVYVFVPVLTYNDRIEYYGDGAPEDYSENLVSQVWRHGDTASDEVEMFGAMPDLSVSCEPGDDSVKDGKIAVKHDYPVIATAKIGDMDVTDYTVWEHAPCDCDCGFDPDEETFLVHVKTCSLTVKKSGGSSEEPYAFRIYKDGTAYTEVTASGGSAVTVYELPVGSYTVEEDGGWSWRYETGFPEGNAAVLSPEGDSAQILCINRSRTGQWLNSFSAVVKNSFGIINDTDKGGR